MNNKDINKAIESILGEPKLFDVRQNLRVLYSDLPLEEAHLLYDAIPEEEKIHYAITSSSPDNYTEDVGLALLAAKRMADKGGNTFVLSFESSGEWKAAFGGYLDHAEYVGGNPAYCTCVAILKYMGKL